MWPEFKAFLTKTNALALAVGVIIGAAMGKVVSALVGDIMMPIIGMILPKGDWREAQIVLSTATDAAGKTTVNAIKYGDFFGNVVDFIVISIVVFLVTKALMKPEPDVPTQKCPYCKETNDIEATRCKACTSALTATA
jgi:large conductance mechanosensitive channel